MVSDLEKQEFSEIIEEFKQKLSKKCSRHYEVIKQVKMWTGRQPFLTRKVCDLIVDIQSTIPAGKEKSIVDELVWNRLIKNWEVQVAREHLKEISDSLLRSENCVRILKLYQQILQQKTVEANNSWEQQMLFRLKLVSDREGSLKVSNLIYKEVFNLNWVRQELAKQELQSDSETNTEEIATEAITTEIITTEEITTEETTTESQEQPVELPENTDNKTPSIPHLWVALLFGAIVIVIPFLNREPQNQESQPVPVQIPFSSPSINTCGTDILEEARDIITNRPSEENLNQIIEDIEKERQKLGGTLNQECAEELHEARYILGRKKADASTSIEDIKEVVRLFCKIPEEHYRKRNYTTRWFQRWSNKYEKTDFPQWLDNYLEDNDDCPAADYLKGNG